MRQLANAIPIVRTDATNPPNNVMRLIVSPVERLREIIADIVMWSVVYVARLSFAWEVGSCSEMRGYSGA